MRYESAVGKRLAQKMKDVRRKIFAVVGDSVFSCRYFLNERPRMRSVKVTIPVRKWARKETKENIVITKIVFGSVEERYFRRKISERLKKMYPMLLGTVHVPQTMDGGKKEISRLDRIDTLSFWMNVFVIMNKAVGIEVAFRIGTSKR